MSASSWNRNPAGLGSKLGTPIAGTAAIRGAVFSCASAVVAGVAARSPLLAAFGARLVGRYPAVVQLACWAAALYFLVRALNTLFAWQESRRLSQEQAKLKPAARALLGVPPARPAAAQEAVKPAQPLAKPGGGGGAPRTPITPPQRHFQAVLLDATAADGGSGSAARTPGSGRGGAAAPLTASPSTAGGARRGASPFTTSSAVATPGGLQQYLDAFNAETTPPSAPPSAADQGYLSSPADQAGGQVAMPPIGEPSASPPLRHTQTRGTQPSVPYSCLQHGRTPTIIKHVSHTALRLPSRFKHPCAVPLPSSHTPTRVS